MLANVLGYRDPVLVIIIIIVQPNIIRNAVKRYFLNNI